MPSRDVVLFSFILVAVYFCSLCFTLDSFNKVPRSGKPNLFGPKTRNGLVGAAAVSAVGLKYYLDGQTFNEEVDLTGRTAIVTGANSGLGKETALKLAQLGAKVIMLIRTEEKGKEAVNFIQSEIGSKADVVAIPLELGSLKSIEACVKNIEQVLGGKNIDILVNNAGIMALPQRATTTDGFEAHFGVNHLGHFALTARLFPLLNENSRIINVASQAYIFGHLDFDNLMLTKEGSYAPWPAYGNSKLSNILFTNELNRRLRLKDSSIFCSSCHPGVCRTDLGRYFFDPAAIPKLYAPLAVGAAAIIGLPFVYFTKSAKQGAQTQIFLSASRKLTSSDSGNFYDNMSIAPLSGEANSAEVASRLWEESERLTGFKFSL